MIKENLAPILEKNNQENEEKFCIICYDDVESDNV